MLINKKSVVSSTEYLLEYIRVTSLLRKARGDYTAMLMLNTVKNFIGFMRELNEAKPPHILMFAYFEFYFTLKIFTEFAFI